MHQMNGNSGYHHHAGPQTLQPNGMSIQNSNNLKLPSIGDNQLSINTNFQQDFRGQTKIASNKFFKSKIDF